VQATGECCGLKALRKEGGRKEAKKEGAKAKEDREQEQAGRSE
jgi:hypothetical protein